MYQSPIEITYKDAVYQFEGAVVKAVQAVDIDVDKDELVKALKYDRGQYEKGYADGKAEAEPKHGQWLKTGQSFVFPEKFRNYFCSECMFELDRRNIRTEYRYCPNCGAKMDEVKNEDND